MKLKFNLVVRYLIPTVRIRIQIVQAKSIIRRIRELL